MADISIPAPDANGYRHFTYRTTDPLDGRWYGGKRSTKKHPMSDHYIGSGRWVARHPERKRLQRKIIEFFANSDDAYAAEAVMVTWDEILTNPLCMNLSCGGEGITPDAHSDPAFSAAHLAGMARRSLNLKWRKNLMVGGAKRAADPKWREANAAALSRTVSGITPERRRAIALKRWADPETRAKNMAGILRGWADNPERRKKVSERAAKHVHSAEARAKISLAARLRAAAKRAAKAVTADSPYPSGT